MRGKVLHLFQRVGGEGITPAYAGKSDKHQRARSWLGDYPRMCGEKSMTSHAIRAPVGSPPRMQGKDIFPDGLPCAVRITPACAGKSLWCAQGQAQERDHPRVCEEKNFLLLMTSRRSGSPPRVRGKGHVCHCSLVCCRITPACAGKSPAIMVCSLEYWGSPPRMRGKVCADVIVHIQPGITPACAGKRPCAPQ